METTNQNVKILVYGTLKEGHYNFKRMVEHFGAGSMTKLEDRTLDGFEMYDLGFYPGIRPTRPGKSGQIKCQLMEVSPRTASFIQLMEESAGYDEMEIDGARIYIYTGPINGCKKIDTGEWL